MNITINSSSNLIIVVFLVSTLILYFSFKDIIYLKGVSLIIFLRILILTLLIILLINPTFEYRGERNLNMPWHVYVDKSLSIKNDLIFEKFESGHTISQRNLVNLINWIEETKI